MADEEDVIFYNSPLYRHLSEVGFTDFDVEMLNDTDKRADSFVSNHLGENNSENLSSRNLTERAVNLVKRLIFGYFLPSTVPEGISFYESCVAMIKSSGLLTEDDLELLYRFEQSTDTAFDTDKNVDYTKRQIGENNSKFTEANNSILFNLVTSRFMIGVTMLIAIILGLLLNTNSSTFRIVSYVSLLVVAVWLLLQMYFLRVKNRVSVFKKNVALLFDYIQFTDKLLVLIRKVILFIQEKELVARGHIIIDPAAPVTRLESQIKQCMILRKCLFLEMNKYIGLLCKKIKDVSNSSFLNNYNNGNLGWLKKELGRIKNECLTQSDKNSKANEYSLLTLKKAFATLGSRQSSLLCCATVNLTLAITYLRQSEEKQDDQFEEFYTCLGDLLEEGEKCLDNVGQCYRFHKVDIPGTLFDENQGHVAPDKTVYSSFSMALRSMTLHLQQACKSSIETEEKLDRLISESMEDSACTDLDEIDKQMLLIGKEIEKLSVCWEESQSRLEEIALSSTGKETIGNSVEEQPNVNAIEQEDSNVFILKYADNADPDPDKIFEGETTSECDDEKQYSSSLGREELLREEKMRAESRHLLKELKSVLATKDEEKMVSIPRALLLKRLGSAESEGTSSKVSSSPVMESFQYEMEENSSMDETISLKLCDRNTDSTFKEQDVNIMQIVTNPPKNLEQPFPGSDNAGTEINEDGDDVVYDSLNERTTNDQPFIGHTSNANPFASMVAAAAAARNRQFGVTEQSYEIDAETFGDESDINM